MIIADSAARTLLRHLYNALSGPLNSPPLLIGICVLLLAALIVLRTRKH
jgi:hypothetical protein